MAVRKRRELERRGVKQVAVNVAGPSSAAATFSATQQRCPGLQHLLGDAASCCPGIAAEGSMPEYVSTPSSAHKVFVVVEDDEESFSKKYERRSLLGGDGGRAHIIDRLYIKRGLSTPALNKSDDPTVLFLMIGVMIGVGLLMFFRTSTDMDHVANPDALLKALDGPVVKYVR